MADCHLLPTPGPVDCGDGGDVDHQSPQGARLEPDKPRVHVKLHCQTRLLGFSDTCDFNHYTYTLTEDCRPTGKRLRRFRLNLLCENSESTAVQWNCNVGETLYQYVTSGRLVTSHNPVTPDYHLLVTIDHSSQDTVFWIYDASAPGVEYSINYEHWSSFSAGHQKIIITLVLPAEVEVCISSTTEDQLPPVNQAS